MGLICIKSKKNLLFRYVAIVSVNDTFPFCTVSSMNLFVFCYVLFIFNITIFIRPVKENKFLYATIYFGYFFKCQMKNKIPQTLGYLNTFTVIDWRSFLRVWFLCSFLVFSFLLDIILIKDRELGSKGHDIVIWPILEFILKVA